MVRGTLPLNNRLHVYATVEGYCQLEIERYTKSSFFKPRKALLQLFFLIIHS